MTHNHTWKAAGSNGAWVHHSAGGSGTDSIGVGLNEDVLGPFGTSHRRGGQTQAEMVADALNNAHAAGKRDGRAEVYADVRKAQRQMARDAKRLDAILAKHGEAQDIVARANTASGDGGSNDAEHDMLTEAVDFIAGLYGMDEEAREALGELPTNSQYDLT